MTAVKQRDKPISTSHDFWLASGFELFDQWLLASKAAWRRNYSWHKNKKRKLQSETEKELHYPSLLGPLTSWVAADVALHQFNDWLEVRKQQWRFAGLHSEAKPPPKPTSQHPLEPQIGVRCT
jgi:hypothetical protein